MDTPQTHPISPGYQSSAELLRDRETAENAELSGVRVAKKKKKKQVKNKSKSSQKKNKSKMKELISLEFFYGCDKASSKLEKRQLPTFHFFRGRYTVQSQVDQHRPGGLSLLRKPQKRLQH